MFKYKVIPEGVMTVLFPVEESFLIVPLGTADRRSIKYRDLIYRSYFTLREESFLGGYLVSNTSNMALPTKRRKRKT